MPKTCFAPPSACRRQCAPDAWISLLVDCVKFHQEKDLPAGVCGLFTRPKTKKPYMSSTYKVFCSPLLSLSKASRAENGTRTRDPQLGKLMLYQLSYFRIAGSQR